MHDQDESLAARPAAVDFADAIESLAVLLDELPVAACLVHAEPPHPIASANGAFSVLTRVPADGAAGRSILEFVATERTREIDGRSIAVLDQDPEEWAGRVRVRQESGGTVACLVAARRISITHQPHHLVTLVDAGPLDARPLVGDPALRSVAFAGTVTPIAIFDLAGHMLECNEAVLEYFGRSRGELLAMEPEELLAADHTSMRPNLLEALMAGDAEAVAFDETYLHADGHALQARTSVAVHFDDAGDPEYFVAEIIDREIGDRRRDAVLVLDHERAADLARAASLRAARAELVATHGLTERDDELLDLLLQGRRVASIASQMFLASGTVRNNLSTLYHRVGVAGQAELLQLVHDIAARIASDAAAPPA